MRNINVSVLLWLFSRLFSLGLCSFENGFCGLKHDNNTEFQWILNSGHSSSRHTGPRYDHTTYSEQGRFSVTAFFITENNCFYDYLCIIF